ncbi:MAG: hypothetical protein SGI77_02645 [Pirellulaceae bacterium]|nr:hypothetical protein [Pirellulaceae bacterium]
MHNTPLSFKRPEADLTMLELLAAEYPNVDAAITEVARLARPMATTATRWCSNPTGLCWPSTTISSPLTRPSETGSYRTWRKLPACGSVGVLAACPIYSV